jgi:hypothetical protein
VSRAATISERRVPEGAEREGFVRPPRHNNLPGRLLRRKNLTLKNLYDSERKASPKPFPWGS